ncbi:MAG: nucleotidyltransferase domain-containing protein [Candidatus Thermoplasmatota archaeon]
MNHEKKVQIAEKVIRRIEEKYEDSYLVGGVYGSVARGEDDEESDIDIIVIMDFGIKESIDGFLIDDCPVNFTVRSIDEAKRVISNPDFSWPWAVSQLVDFKVIRGDSKVKEELQDEISKVNQRGLNEAVAEQLPEIYAVFYKARRNYREDDYENFVTVTLDCLNGIAGSIALLNQRYFKKNFFFRIRETLGYEKTPKNYSEFLKKTTDFKNPDDMFKGLEELFNNFIEFIEDEGIEIPNYSNLADIGI